LPPWRPVDNQNRPAQLTKTVSAAQVFEAASDAVWVVVAQGAGGWVAQGSAVAVTSRELVTNCHVIVGGASVTLRQRRQQRTATLVAANRASDRCILAVSGDALPVVAPTRPYRSLRVGEDVLTIGSPVGLESTLGNGIISGLRRLRGQSLVQTTAPISAGSSGGGLFDTYGNLIGITTFMLKTRSSSISRLPSTSTFDDRPSPLIGSLS
jgi:S1-C subfamily serine protease